MAKGSADLQKKFQDAGFEVTEIAVSSDSFSVKKGACKASISRRANGSWEPAGPPTFNVRGLDCRLEDRGYQKFWLNGDKRFPIRLGDLRTVQAFDQEVRAVLGTRSLYHESLGTRNARTAYDRLDGRPDQ